VPCTMNGQVCPGRGEPVSISGQQGAASGHLCQGRELAPYVADGVPGWFQPCSSSAMANGKEVAYDDDFRFNPDPVIYYDVPRTASIC